LRSIVTLALLGGLAFWLPDVLLHSLALFSPTFADLPLVFVSTVVLPAALFVAWRSEKRSNLNPSAALWMLLGVWFMGPLMMMLGFSFEPGSGFRQGSLFAAVGRLLLFTALFPVFTFTMSAYDASMGALGIGTVMMLALAAYRFVSPRSTNKT
jgi:hypothetical protein